MTGYRAWAHIVRNLPWRVMRLLAIGLFVALGGRT